MKVTGLDFKKLVKFLEKEGQDGCDLDFEVSHHGHNMQITAYDRQNRKIGITIYSADTPMKPTVTRTEPF